MARSSANRKALARYKSQTNQMLRRAKLPAFDDFAVILRAAAAGNESAIAWLEKLGIEPVRVGGCGRQYRLTADQVLIRKGKRQVSEAQRERLRQNAHFGGKNTSPTRVLA